MSIPAAIDIMAIVTQAQLPGHGSLTRTNKEHTDQPCRSSDSLPQPKPKRAMAEHHTERTCAYHTRLVLAGPRILNYKSYRPPRPKRAKSTKRPLLLPLHASMPEMVQGRLLLPATRSPLRGWKCLIYADEPECDLTAHISKFADAQARCWATDMKRAGIRELLHRYWL